MVYYGLSMVTLRSHGGHRGRKLDWGGVNTMAVEMVAWMSGYSAGRRHFRFAKVVLYK